MRRLGIFGFPLLAGATLFSGCSHEAAPIPETIGRSTSDLELAPMPIGGVDLQLGMGWDTDRQQPRSICINPRLIDTGTEDATSKLYHSFSESDAEELLHIKGGLSVRAGLYNVAANFDYASSMVSSNLSETLIYNADYAFKGKSLDTRDPSNYLTPIGRAAFNNGTWRETCGDHVITQDQRGARFNVVFRLDFATHADKQDIEAKVDVSGPMFSVMAGLESHSKEFSKRVTVRLEAHQQGGSVENISRIFSGVTGVEGTEAAIQCGVDNMTSCKTVLTRAMDYATNTTNGFPSDIRGKPAIFGYATLPYTSFALPTVPQIVGAEIQDARATVANAFETNLASKRLLMAWKRAFVSSTESQELDAWLVKTAQNGAAIQEAIDACYMRLDTSTPSTITACLTAANGLAAKLVYPPDTLVGAGAIRAAIHNAIYLAGGETITGAALDDPHEVPNLVWGPEGPPPATGRPQYQQYRNGTVYWTPGLSAHYLTGKLSVKYGTLVSLGKINTPAAIGFPVRDVENATDGAGKVLRLERGSIFWDGDLGHDAYSVQGSIAARFALAREVAGALGYPRTDQTMTVTSRQLADGGQYNLFDRGAIYARPSGEAKLLSGRVYDRWIQLGRTTGPMGFPTGDVTPVGDGVGEYADFDGGSIYAGPRGAYEMSARHAIAYRADMGPQGCLGYPTGADAAWGDDTDAAIRWYFDGFFRPGVARSGNRQPFDHGIIIDLLGARFHTYSNARCEARGEIDWSWVNRNGSWYKGSVISPEAGGFVAGSEDTPWGPRSLPLCAAHYDGSSLHPGKYVDGRCLFSYGGKELSVDENNFEALYRVRAGSSHWVDWTGTLPAGAYQGGHEANVSPIYVCRAPINGGMTPGKIVGTACAFPFGGIERWAGAFQALVIDP